MKITDRRSEPEEPTGEDTTPGAEPAPEQAPAPDRRVVSASYTLGLMINCDKEQGGCGRVVFLSDPGLIQGALVNAPFKGPCPHCKADLAMRPSQQIVAVPAQAMQQLNRQQRRAMRAGH